MKYLLLLLLIPLNVIAQDYGVISKDYFKTPDVHNFEKHTLSNAKGSSGALDITIGLFKIDFEGLKIPISLSYNTTGVKINSQASRVGLNWNLNAGGVISREIIDGDDYSINAVYSDGCYVHTTKGYLRSGSESSDPVQDGYPDIHRAYAPGLATEFLYKDLQTAFELKSSNNKIITAYDPLVVNIINTKGVKYTFSEVERGKYDIKHDQYNLSSSNGPHNDLLVPAFNSLGQYNTPFFHQYTSNNYISNYLTKIEGSGSDNIIKFFYEGESLFDNNRHIEFIFDNNTLMASSQKDYRHDLQLTKRLTRIKFNDGVIIFSYLNDRQDLIGSKSLDKIELRDNFGVLIKAYNFIYTYFSKGSCVKSNCLRLKLDEIFVSNAENEKLPYYKFNYIQPNELPEKYSLKQDYLGYYNKTTLIAQSKDLVPTLYTKADQFENTVLPFNPNIGGNIGYNPTNGNLSLEPNFNLAKIGSLSSIVFPTGDQQILTYELNSFNFKNKNIIAPGLRIKEQEIINSSNYTILKKSYNYNLENTSTSSGFIIKAPNLRGYLTNLPNFGVFDNKTGQGNSSDVKLINNSFVSYKKITVLDLLGNGKEVLFFTTNEDYPEESILTANNFSKNFTNNQFYTLNFSDIADDINNGRYNTVYYNNDSFYGNISRTEIYDNNNILKKSTEFQYNIKVKDFIGASKKYSTHFLDYPCDIPTRKTYSFPQKIYSHNLNLEKKIETEHFSSNDIITTSDFYYNEKNHIDEVVNWLNTNEYLKETKFYVYDDIFINEPYRQDLIDKNIIAMPLVTKYYKNNRLLRKQKSTYGLFNSKFLLKSSMQAKGEQDYEIDFEVINYNHRKKGLEIKNKDEVVTSYIYDGTGIGVASILENTSYNEIDANIINEFKNSFTENEIENSITLLRNTYPNKMIKSIIQRPLIGVSKVIEPNGNFIIYDYDSFNRLNLIKDEDNNILKEYNYNYKLTPMHPIQVAPLSGEIIINYINDINDLPVLDVYNANISANIRGGIGNYQYQWRSVLNGPIISNKLNFISSIPCGTSKVHYLKIIDSTTGSELNLTLTQQSHICNQPLAVTSASNYTLDYKQGRVISVNAIGGSWQYKYQFFNNPPSHSNSYSVSAAVCPRTSIIPVKIIDAITNEYIAQNITVTVICQGYIWDEEEQHCFVAGTKITMADGNEKNIEDVNIGDKIATYNVKKEKIEIESVLNVVNPIHSRMVQLYFNNGVKNTNTLDHPYYVKNKGWASFNPELTKENYDLNVRSLENGDVVLFYNSKENKVEPIKLVDHKIIIKKQLTYNLDKVSKNHNFFANGILVHNKSSFTNSKPKN